MKHTRLMQSPLIKQPFYTLTAGGTALMLVFCIIAYPDEAFQASLQGLKVWWNMIFPALLPFLILSQMLMAYGFVHGLGVLLDPLMRALFRIPGAGGWAWAAGWTAGYPAGAEAVVALRKQELINRQEGERLLGLSHASSPVFMIAVVGVGFMEAANTGLSLAIVHWLSALVSMLLIRLLSSSKAKLPAGRASADAQQFRPLDKSQPNTSPSLLKRVLHTMEQAHRSDGRSLGKLLGEATASAVQTLMMIGGYMMIFSVLIQVMKLLMPDRIGSIVLNGLFEVNLGAFTIGTLSFSSPVFQAALVSAVLAWSGFSAHLQVHSLIKQTDLRYAAFLQSRLLHAVCAFGLTYLCWTPLQSLLLQWESAMPTLAISDTTYARPEAETSLDRWISLIGTGEGWGQWPALLLFAGGLLALFIIGSVIAKLLSHYSR
ncbi:nucleoside recognition domain-containing protein [Paenibacillus aquistagni]|uniref:nucleoside recognition domain-containing protein n=1 Tax=Paenibacillus aquistagni TaxID=1852522 RepID=UPI001F0D2F2B|nr:nucleoside recognition domain-containing protein [Paenibacillus aquistagni]